VTNAALTSTPSTVTEDSTSVTVTIAGTNFDDSDTVVFGESTSTEDCDSGIAATLNAGKGSATSKEVTVTSFSTKGDYFVCVKRTGGSWITAANAKLTVQDGASASRMWY
jgi:hypothetical protein